MNEKNVHFSYNLKYSASKSVSGPELKKEVDNINKQIKESLTGWETKLTAQVFYIYENKNKKAHLIENKGKIFSSYLTKLKFSSCE